MSVSIDETDELMMFFAEEWPDVSKMEYRPNRIICENVAVCTYGDKCQFSHHPQRVFARFPVAKNCTLWNEEWYQKWVLKYPCLKDPQHMALRIAILLGNNTTVDPGPIFCTALNDVMIAYCIRRDALILQKEDAEAKRRAQQIRNERMREKNAARKEHEKRLQQEKDHADELRARIGLSLKGAGTLAAAGCWLTDVNAPRHLNNQAWTNVASYLTTNFNEIETDATSGLAVDTLELLCDLVDVCKLTTELAHKQVKIQDASLTEKKRKKAKSSFETLNVSIAEKVKSFWTKYGEVLAVTVSVIVGLDAVEGEEEKADTAVLDSLVDVTITAGSASETHDEKQYEGDLSPVSPGASVDVIQAVTTLRINAPAPVADVETAPKRLITLASYTEMCCAKYAAAGGEEVRPLYGECCDDHLEPTLFNCKKCVEMFFCARCISDHREGKNVVKRSHSYKLFCPGCFTFEDLELCGGCESDSDCLRCADCHKQEHKRKRADKHTVAATPFGIEDLLAPNNAATAAAGSAGFGREAYPAADPAVSPSRQTRAAPTTPTAGPITTSTTGIEAVPMTEKLQLMLNNARVRHLLEDVVHPLLVQAFRVAWHSRGNFCSGCNATHSVEAVQLDPCIKTLIEGRLAPTHSAWIAYTKGTTQRVSEFETQSYDVTAVSGILSCLCATPGSGNNLYARVDSETICHWRNETFHPTTLPTLLFTRAYSAIPNVCFRLIANMKRLVTDLSVHTPTAVRSSLAHWNKTFNLQEKVDTCSVSFARSDIQKHQEREWLREAERSLLIGVSRVMARCNVPRNQASLDLARRLLDTEEVKLLVIPPFEQYPASTDIAFFARLGWTAIIDLNSPFTWSSEEFAPRKLVYKPSDENYSTFGATNILYLDNPYHSLWELLKERLQESLQIFVLATGSFQLTSAAAGAGGGTSVLYDCLRSISRECKYRAWSYEVIPMFECAQDLLQHTKFLWREHLWCNASAAQQAPLPVSEAADFVCVYASSLAIVGAYVLASANRISRCCILGVNKERFGFPLDLMLDFSGIELLVEGFDAVPPSVDASESAEEAVEDAIVQELPAFLSREEVSWFLLREGVVVKRKQLDELLCHFEKHDKELVSVVTLVHGTGQGGTTLARHALYLLSQRGFVCMVVREPPPRRLFDEFVAVLQRIRTAMGRGIKGAVLLVNMNGLTEDQKNQVKNFIYHVKERCHEFCTFLVTTSRRLQQMQDQQSIISASGDGTTAAARGSRPAAATSSSAVVDLSPDLTAGELAQFSNLLKRCNAKRPPVILKGYNFPLDDYGMLDVAEVRDQSNLWDILGRCSMQELIDGGCTLSDVIALDLTECKDEGSRPPTSYQLRAQKKRRMPLFGMLAFLPEYRAATQTRMARMIEELSPGELRVLKLCTFYSLFTNQLKVSLKLASLVHRNGVLGQDEQYTIDRFSPLSELLVVDTVAGLSLINTNFGYLLAELTAVFGPKDTREGLIDPVKLKVSIDRVSDYVSHELFPVIFGGPSDKSSTDTRHHNFAQRKVVRTLATSGLREAFCEFDVWHPGSIPAYKKKTFSGKLKPPAMHESFLIEALLKRRAPHNKNQFSMIKSWFNTLIMFYQDKDMDKERLIFSTRASRFVSYKAMMQKDFALIEEARDLVTDKFDVEFSVCDALGNVCKRHVLLYRRMYQQHHNQMRSSIMQHPPPNTAVPSHTPTPSRTTDAPHTDLSATEALYCESSSDNDSDSDEEAPVDSREEYVAVQNPVQFDLSTRLQHLQCVTSIALEGYLWFMKAVVISQYKNSFPMIAAVQTLVACMECMRYIVADGNKSKFVDYHLKPTSHATIAFRPLLMILTQQRFVEKCTNMLSRARSSNLRATESGSYEHSYKTTQTNKYITENETKLAELSLHESRHCYAEVPIVFDVTEAKLLMIKGNRSSIVNNTSALAWCVVTYECSLVSRINATEESADQTLSLFETVEKYFLASAMLAGRVTGEPQSRIQCELTKYSDAARVNYPTLNRSTLTLRYLQGIIQRWIENCDKVVAKSETSATISATSGSIGFSEGRRKNSYGAVPATATRSYYGLEARLCLLMVYISQVSTQYTEECAHKLQVCVDELKQFADQLSNSAVPRIFLASNELMPRNPFGKFIFVEDTELGIACKQLSKDPERREQEYRLPKYKNLLAVLHGEVIVGGAEGDARSYLKCEKLGITLGYHIPSYPTLKRGKVTFVLGITDRGIRAYGIQVCK